MAYTSRYWYFFLFIGVQIFIVSSMIYRENAYVASLYKLQKLEQFQIQLTNEYNTLQHELQKNKNLGSLKEYAEQSLHLQKLPISAFRVLYDADML